MTALNGSQEKQAWGQYCTAQYYLRGGKDGNGPQEHAYQYVYSLHIDNYAGYFVADQTWGGKLVTTYSYNREFCDGPYGAFKAVRDNVMNTLNRPQIDSVPELKAIGLLILTTALRRWLTCTDQCLTAISSPTRWIPLHIRSWQQDL